jgi:hydrogenase assembly chaperone HypC/HupF
MCIGVPMRVLESDGATALCEGRGGRRRLNMLMVGDCPQGSWVLSSLGYARERIGEGDAARINCVLDELEAATRGDDRFEDGFTGFAEQSQSERRDDGKRSE